MLEHTNLSKKQIKVAIALILDGERILLIQRYEPRLPEAHLKWELPGGKVECNENPEETVVREVKEEVNLAVQPIELIPYIHTNIWRYPGYFQYTTVICYLCKPLSLKSGIALHDKKVVSYKWVKIKEINLRRCLHGIRNFIAWVAETKFCLILNPSDYFYIRLERKQDKSYRKRFYILSNQIWEPVTPHQLQ